MAVVDLAKAKSQLIAILQASRTAYSATVDSSKRQFSSDTEILDAILFADGEICHAIIRTPGHPFTNAFKQTSASLVNADTLPTFSGRILDVTHCATTNGTFLPAIKASSREEVLEMRDHFGTFHSGDADPVLTEATHILPFYFIEDATVYFVDAFGRVTYTDYTRTATTQAPEAYASAVVAGAVARLLKDGGDDNAAQYYGQMYSSYLQDIRGGAAATPELV